MQRKASAAPDHGKAVRWDDIQMFVALLQQPSLTKAAASLGVDTSTLSRRLAALEERLGLALFDRTATGVRLTEAAGQLASAARAMEGSALAFARETENLEQNIEGLVRLSAPPGVVEGLLVPALPRLLARYSRIVLELDATAKMSDLTRREADIAIRTRRPTSGTLVSKKVYTGPLWPLGSFAYVRELGALSDVGDARWIGPEESADDPLRRGLGLPPPVLRAQSLVVQMRAAAEGLGLVWAARHFGITYGLAPLRVAPRLKKRLAALPPVELWLVAHDSYRTVPRLAAVWSFVEDEFVTIVERAAQRDRDERA